MRFLENLNRGIIQKKKQALKEFEKHTDARLWIYKV